MSINPEDLNAVYEFQGGAFDGWLVDISVYLIISHFSLNRGGSGYDTCAILTGTEFERGVFVCELIRCRMTKTSTVFYKNEFAMSTTYLNLYMIFGGTNWGGIAHPGTFS